MNKKEFTEKDLVSFGNYLLSKGRAQSFRKSPVPKKERLQVVHKSDLDNWKEKK